MKAELRKIPNEAFLEAFENLKTHCQRCINAERDHFEGDPEESFWLVHFPLLQI